MPTKLDDVMRGALQEALRFGALERWPGGWWTYPGCRVSHQQMSAFHGQQLDVPAWSVGIGAVLGLVMRGDLAFPDNQRPRHETRAVPTDRARNLI